MSNSPTQTQAPFDQAFSELKASKGWSYREIASRAADADPAGRGFSQSHLAHLGSGVDRPSPHAIVILAEVFGLSPAYFTEYRLAQVRALFDEAGPHGPRGALAMYEKLDSTVKHKALSIDVSEHPLSLPSGSGPAMRRRATR
jgi:transcriptional regulator with XRE-family HTH domain